MKKYNPNYKWYVLALSTLSYLFITGIMRMCMPVLFSEISTDLNLSLVQLGTIWGFDPFGGVFVALISGLIVDRFGAKRTIVLICVISGIFGAARGLSTSFAGILSTTFLFGLVVAMTPTILPKVVAVWFGGRRLGLGNAILSTGLVLGYMAATALSATVVSPLLGGWRNVLFLYGLPPVILCFVWIFTYREPGQFTAVPVSSEKVSFKEAFSHIVRNKQVWLLGIVEFGALGAYLGVQGYLPSYLSGLGWSETSSDLAMTVLVGASLVTNIPIGLLSDRLGSRKRVLVPILILLAATRALIPFASGAGIWVLVALNGLVSGCFFPLTNTLIVETAGVGKKYAGTAIGIASTLGMLGQTIFAPAGNAFARINAGLPFIVWAVLSGAIIFCFFFIKEQRQTATSSL